jgi:hypothetical protein
MNKLATHKYLIFSLNFLQHRKIQFSNIDIYSQIYSMLPVLSIVQDLLLIYDCQVSLQQLAGTRQAFYILQNLALVHQHFQNCNRNARNKDMTLCHSHL